MYCYSNYCHGNWISDRLQEYFSDHFKNQIFALPLRCEWSLRHAGPEETLQTWDPGSLGFGQLYRQPAKPQQAHHFYSHLLSSHIGMSKLTHLLAAETGIQATWAPTELRCEDKVCCSALWKEVITWMTLLETHTPKNENLWVFMKKQREWKPRNSMSCFSLL